MPRLSLPIFVIAVFGVLAAGANDLDAPDRDAYLAPHAERSMLLALHVTDAAIFAAGEHGHILISRDGGQSFDQVPVPTRSTLTGIYFANDELGFAVGHDAVILRSRDAGRNWEKVYFDPDGEKPLLDVWFADENYGIAIGAYGLMLVTRDGGDSWERRKFFSQRLPFGDPDTASSGTDEDDEDDFGDAEDNGDPRYEFEDYYADPDFGEDYHLNKIAAAPDGTLYICGERGKFYRSDDGGDTWLRLPTVYEGSYFSVLPMGGGRILVAGMRGNLFNSNDQGESWEQLDIGGITALLTSSDRLGDLVIVAGLGGAVLESNDGGRSFTLHRQNDRKGIMAMTLLGEDPATARFLSVGEEGFKYLSLTELRSGGSE